MSGAESLLYARCTGWAEDLYLAGEVQKCPDPQAFEHYKDTHKSAGSSDPSC